VVGIIGTTLSGLLAPNGGSCALGSIPLLSVLCGLPGLS
jgi:hypothetical protein